MRDPWAAMSARSVRCGCQSRCRGARLSDAPEPIGRRPARRPSRTERLEHPTSGTAAASSRRWPEKLQVAAGWHIAGCRRPRRRPATCRWRPSRRTQDHRRRSCRKRVVVAVGDGIIAGVSVVGGSSPIASPGIHAWQRRERFAQRPLRVIQQRSELVEQLMFLLPNGTQVGMELLRALGPLALVVHV